MSYRHPKNPDWEIPRTALGPDELTKLRPPFLYTVPQIAQLINVNEHLLRKHYLYFRGVTAGRPLTNQMIAINIAEEGERWRVSDAEFYAWLERLGFNPSTKSILTPPKRRRKGESEDDEY